MPFIWDQNIGVGDRIDAADIVELQDRLNTIFLYETNDSWTWSASPIVSSGQKIEAGPTSIFQELRDATEHAYANFCNTHYYEHLSLHYYGYNSGHNYGENTNYDGTDNGTYRSGHKSNHNVNYHSEHNHNDYTTHRSGHYGTDNFSHNGSYNSGDNTSEKRPYYSVDYYLYNTGHDDSYDATYRVYHMVPDCTSNYGTVA